MKLIHKMAALIALMLFLSAHQGSAQDTTFHYLALGDSYTIGESVAAAERWPVQLADRLRALGIPMQPPFIVATTGWTTGELMDALKRSDLNPPYDLVSLLIGVNDQYRGYEISGYPGNFRALLQTAIRLAGNRPGRVLVLSIPDYGVTPFGRTKNPAKIADEIDRYNSINRAISDSLGTHYVNITPISREAAHDSSLVADDGLHPSGEMYSRWVDRALPIVMNIFQHAKTSRHEPH